MSSGLSTRKIQGYGWEPDLPDHRDRIFNLEKKVFSPHQVPPSLDLTPQMPPVYDQLALGSCTGNGIAGLLEHAEMANGSPADTPSRLFIYFNERVMEGTVSQDAGAEIRDGIKSVNSQGAPSETLWPYDISKFADQPPQNVYDEAAKHEAITYLRVQVGGPGTPLRSALVQGFPIVFGMPVPDYFESGWDPATTPLPLPGPNANIIGGHCMVIVGYDFSQTQFSVPVFKVRNSWGSSWGEAGHCYLHYHWFAPNDALASDMWVIEKAS